MILDKKQIIEELGVLGKGVEMQILETPTGARREALTGANIYLGKALLILEKLEDDYYKDIPINPEPNYELCPHKKTQHNDQPGYNQCQDCGRLTKAQNEIGGE